jgi:hypothetical protein
MNVQYIAVHARTAVRERTQLSGDTERENCVWLVKNSWRSYWKNGSHKVICCESGNDCRTLVELPLSGQKQTEVALKPTL